MKYEPSRRVYVPVGVIFDKGGRMHPSFLTWENGQQYVIEQVTEIRPTFPGAGNRGERYTIWIQGRKRYLFFERGTEMDGCHYGRWFVERKKAS